MALAAPVAAAAVAAPVDCIASDASLLVIGVPASVDAFVVDSVVVVPLQRSDCGVACCFASSALACACASVDCSIEVAGGAYWASAGAASSVRKESTTVLFMSEPHAVETRDRTSTQCIKRA